MFSNAVRLFSIGGFSIRLDPSWVIIAGLITWSLAAHYFPDHLPDQSAATYLLMAVVATLLFFASLVLHELAHSVVARRLGLPMKGITLFLFGGLAEMEREPPTARVEFLVAIAGPLASFGLAFVFDTFAGLAAISEASAPLVATFDYLAFINLVLAIFNLVPAFPLDGGRILRAYLWHRHGDLLRATRAAARGGVTVAFVLMGLGVLMLFRGAGVSALWQVLIGGFLLMAARGAYQSQLAHHAFGARVVGELMQSPAITVSPDATLSHLVDAIMLRHGLTFVPVVDEGVLVGHVDRKILARTERADWATTRVGDVYAGLDGTLAVSPDLPVETLLEMVTRTGRRKFVVVDGRTVAGVISLSDLARHLRTADLGAQA